jgi:hypothetical protein
MSARIVVTLILEYDGSDTDVYDAAMKAATEYVSTAGDDTAGDFEAVRVVDVQVSG